MPQLAAITPACWITALPQTPEDRFQLLTDDGWADQSALFFPDRYAPAPIAMLITGGNLTELSAKLTAIRALRKTKVRVDDGLLVKDKCLVLGVKAGPPARCGMIIGGTAPADTWEQELVVAVLLPSPAVA
jgi:hypothetical protein